MSLLLLKYTKQQGKKKQTLCRGCQPDRYRQRDTEKDKVLTLKNSTMKIELISQQDYEKLMDIYSSYPNLSLQNKGYEGIDKESLSTEELEKMTEVNSILKKSISGFSRFQNFRINQKTGKPEIRLQYNYNYDGKGVSFIGVGYILIEELLNGFCK